MTGPAAARWAMLAVVWTVGIANALALWIAASPANAVKRSISAYLAPYRAVHAAHSWKLFAPNPLSSNVTVFLRARLADGRETMWYDVSTPLLHDVQHNRFTETQPVFEALSHALSSCARQVRRNEEECDGTSGTDADRLILRTAFAEFTEMSAVPPQRVTAVQISIVRSRLPRFEQHAEEVAIIRPPGRALWAPVARVAPLRSWGWRL